MDLVVIGLSSLAALMTLTLLVWLPKHSIKLFGVSPWQMRRKIPEEMAELICLGFLKQSFRVEQDYFDLPKTSFLVISPTGERILFNTASWSARQFSAAYWNEIERQRRHTRADHAWALRPGMDGSWGDWLKQSCLLHVSPCSFSQLFRWLHERQTKVTLSSTNQEIL